MSCFFILSCARSGSTSLAKILDTASNGCCEIEPPPNLNRETRDAMDGKILHLEKLVEETLLPAIRKRSRQSDIYGEKSVNYGPFITYLYDKLDCRFVFLKRDGRDVVRSLMDWHEQMFGTVYRECRDTGNLSPRALLAAAKLPVHLDASDYSRPRPSTREGLFEEWDSLSREEMCAYYWTRINDFYLEKLSEIPANAWCEIDYTSPNPKDIAKVADFCGLQGILATKIQQMLDQRINSLEDRCNEKNRYPDWRNWNGGVRRNFDRIAGNIMERMGYGNPSVYWRPSQYGSYWQTKENFEDWYAWMHEGRFQMHQDFLEWLRQRNGAGEEIDSVMDFGCGVGIGYSDELRNKEYVGIDLSRQNIDWCLKNLHNSRHRYFCLDVIQDVVPHKSDMVFSSGTIDNSYDMDAYLTAMVLSSKKWIYATAYRGWFPYLLEHRYQWDEKTGTFYNDLSPHRSRQVLSQLGCYDIVVEPVRTGRSDIPFETLIRARVPRPHITHEVRFDLAETEGG